MFIKKTTSLKLLRPALLILLMLAVLSAPLSARVFAWKDKNGRTIYSDSPPPDNATPAGDNASDNPSYAGPGGDDTDGAKSEDDKPKDPSLEAQKAAIDKNKAFEERQKKQAEEANKKAQEAQALAQKQQACNDSKNYLRTLQSGTRLVTVGDDGKRSYMNADDTNAEIAKAQESINANCK